MRFAIRVRAFLILALVLLAPASALAQGAAMPTCMTLLPSEVIAKAVGETFRDLGSEVSRSGASDCEWAVGLGTAAVKTLSVTFYDVVALKASPAYASADDYFDTIVKGAERRGAKSELVPGVGVRTTFLPTTPQTLVVVQRKDGVARMVGNNLTKAQMLALARALAAP
jgi:hypothetical protein